jgi:hypothetical protein
MVGETNRKKAGGLMYIVEWNGNKYVYTHQSSAWYGHYGRRSDGYPGDNMMVPVSNWGHLFQAAKEQGHNIVVKKSADTDAFDDDSVETSTSTRKKKSGGIAIFEGSESKKSSKSKSNSNSIKLF